MCFVFIWEQTATCATYSVNWLVFVTEMKSVYCAVRTGSLNKAVCCIYLRTNSDLCHLQHKLFGFYNPDEKRLLSGTNCVFKWSSLRFVFKALTCLVCWRLYHIFIVVVCGWLHDQIWSAVRSALWTTKEPLLDLGVSYKTMYQLALSKPCTIYCDSAECWPRIATFGC